MAQIRTLHFFGSIRRSVGTMTRQVGKSCAFLVVAFIAIHVNGQLIESERVNEYCTRNHTWPPRDVEYTPNTPGWRKLFERRFRQIDKLNVQQNSYNTYLNAIHAGLLCPNFTESGWGLTRAPAQLVEELQQSLTQGLANKKIGHETEQVCIEGDNRPLFISQPQLNEKTLAVLRPILEAWSGVKLIGSNAYGLRVYQNNSSLNMHVDRVETHVISTILHVGHDKDSEPWPIVIEDYQGNTVEANLEAGDMLLYESSKNYHARPKKFNGSWYSSIFVHYYPVDWDTKIRQDTHYRVPPTWLEQTPDNTVEDLEAIETSIKEPSCAHQWCAMSNTVKWSGPAEAYGVVQSTHGNEKLDLPPENSLPHLDYRDEL